jgi:hypothetical protein
MESKQFGKLETDEHGNVLSPFMPHPDWVCPCGQLLTEETAIKTLGEFKGGVYRVGLCPKCAEAVAGFLRCMINAHKRRNKEK